jgi:hypothetical protein
MFENENKIDCIDSLVFGLNRARDWRRNTAAKYPSDGRNIRAADCLSKLATEASQLSDDAWSQLQPHYGWASERFREAISQTARLVGFKHKIKDVPSFVKHLLEVLSEQHVSN